MRMRGYIWVAVVLAACLLIVVAQVRNAPNQPIPLWKGNAPGEPRISMPEHDLTTDSDRKAAGQRISRITDITVPTLTVYQPPKEKRTGTAVLVFPGGAYRYLAIDIEGVEICEWLNSLGVTAILVKYRVPAPEGTPPFSLAVQDGQRALRVVRAHAAEWEIDPKRVGVIGFSAGAHLSATLGAMSAKPAYAARDKVDDLNPRPDFTMLLYPGMITIAGTTQLHAEVQPGPETPPTFLVQTEDDSVRVENSLAYYAALKAAKIPAEMHLYSTGGHGYGARHSSEPASSWPARAEDWMRAQGFLGKRAGR